MERKMAGSQKYNPDYHSSVVKNLRQVWKEAKQNAELTLTDEEVWDVFIDYYFDERDDDIKFLEGMQEALRFKGVQNA
jgi:hypothetical protein